MKKRIGTVRLPEERITLKYYAFGSRKDGYGLEVVELAGGGERRERCPGVTRSRARFQRLCAAVVRGAVFPGFLAEAIAEWE